MNFFVIITVRNDNRVRFYAHISKICKNAIIMASNDNMKFCYICFSRIEFTISLFVLQKKIGFDDFDNPDFGRSGTGKIQE